MFSSFSKNGDKRGREGEKREKDRERKEERKAGRRAFAVESTCRNGMSSELLEGFLEERLTGVGVWGWWGDGRVWRV